MTRETENELVAITKKAWQDSVRAYLQASNTLGACTDHDFTCIVDAMEDAAHKAHKAYMKACEMSRDVFEKNERDEEAHISFDARVQAFAASQQNAPSATRMRPSSRATRARGEPVVAYREGLGMVTICPPRNARNPMRLLKTAYGPVSRAVTEANRVGALRGREPSAPAFRPATMFRPKATV